MSAGFIDIGDVLRREVAVSCISGSMQLPYILQSWNLMKRSIGRPRASLLQPVVHDGHPRSKRGESCRDVDVGAPVVGNEVCVHWPDQTLRTREVEERSPAQIAEIEKAELAETNDHSCGARVLIGIGWRGWTILALGIDSPCACQSRGQRRACRAHDHNFEIMERQTLSRRRLEVLSSRAHA